MSSGKGSSRRGDAEARRKFEENYARAFGKKRRKPRTLKEVLDALPEARRKAIRRIQDSMDPYPSWVCHECAMAADGDGSARESTWHMGYCGVCHLAKPVTEPRDYGFPRFSG